MTIASFPACIRGPSPEDSEPYEEDLPLDALPIIPITDESIVLHGEDEVFWLVYEPEWIPELYPETEGWVIQGSWLKEFDQ